MRPTVLLSALLVVPAVVSAQSNSLVGNWSVSVPSGMRIENGEATQVFAAGTLAVKQEGDSLVGMLKMQPQENGPERPPMRLATKAVTGKVTFVSHSQARMVMNGEEKIHNAVVTYNIEVIGDSLKGTVVRDIEGVEEEMKKPQPITGKRLN